MWHIFRLWLWCLIIGNVYRSCILMYSWWVPPGHHQLGLCDPPQKAPQMEESWGFYDLDSPTLLPIWHEQSPCLGNQRFLQLGWAIIQWDASPSHHVAEPGGSQGVILSWMSPTWFCPIWGAPHMLCQGKGAWGFGKVLVLQFSKWYEIRCGFIYLFLLVQTR